MAGMNFESSVNNQGGVPMMFAAALADFPPAGIPFRIGIRTDSPYGVYMDTGSAFVLIAQVTGPPGTLSATAPIFYNSGTGVISSQPASSSQEGYITTGSQSFAGVKTFTASPRIASSANSSIEVAAGDITYSAFILLMDRTTNVWSLNKLGSTQNFEIYNHTLNQSAIVIDNTNNAVQVVALSSGMLKSVSGVLTPAVADTDYLTPTGSGSGLTGVVLLTGTQSVGGLKTFTQGIAVQVSLDILTANTAADQMRYNATVASTNEYNNNAAAGIVFQYKFNSAGNLAAGGGISVVKENTLDGDFASKISLYNRANGGNVTEVFTVSSAGIPQIPLLTGSATEMVTISTNGTLGRTAIPSGGGGGSVVTIGVASSNGLAGTSDGNSTNPTLTLSVTVSGMVKANGTSFSAAVGDTDYQVPLTFSTGLTRTVNTITINQGFAPTWTGIHTFNNDIVASAQINMSAQSAARIIGGSTDFAVNNAANNASNLVILDNGNTTVRGSFTAANITFASVSAGRIIGGTIDFAINNADNTQNNLVVLDNGNVTARGTISATNFSGSSSGTNTGDQTTITGNAGSATVLQNARNIQGVSFNGSANIDIINGTGFVKATGTTLSYDNTTYAPLASPALTGTPTAPTPSADDNSTKIATTAYVDSKFTGYGGEFSYTGPSTVTLTVTFGFVVSGNYAVCVTPTNVAAASQPCYITNKLSTGFEIILISPNTNVSFDWIISPAASV